MKTNRYSMCVVGVLVVFGVGCGLPSSGDRSESGTGDQSTVEEPSGPEIQTQDTSGQNKSTGTESALGRCIDGGEWCLARCDGFTRYHVVGHVSSIPYGWCTEAAVDLCRRHGRGYNAACWGIPD